MGAYGASILSWSLDGSETVWEMIVRLILFMVSSFVAVLLVVLTMRVFGVPLLRTILDSVGIALRVGAALATVAWIIHAHWASRMLERAVAEWEAEDRASPT